MYSPRLCQFYPAATIVFFTCIAAANAMNAAPPAIGHHHGTEADHKAIEQLLESYTQSVTDGDQKRFESLLQQLDIPFFSTGGLPTTSETKKAVDTHDYRSFKAAIFDSGKRYHQQFYNIKIEQDGNLAQVSLDFVTTLDASGDSGYGWKILHLLKIRGEWKIASEFYTGYALEAAN